MNKDHIFQYIVNHLKISKVNNDPYKINLLENLYNSLYAHYIHEFENMEPERFIEFVIVSESFCKQLSDLFDNKTVTEHEDVLELYSTLLKLYKTENFIPIDDNKKSKAN